jgi:hypothetical protein
MTKEKSPAVEQFNAALAAHVGCVKPYCFIRRADKEMLAPRSFDMQYNRVVNAIDGVGSGKGAKYRDNAAKAAIASFGLAVAHSICYRPDGPPMIDGKFNMWSDPGIEPLEGTPTIFLEHVDYLIPVERERRLLLQWLAWMVQHPEQKIMWALLIVGRGGTGKSFVGRLMERLLGAENVALISEEDTVTSTFNGFSENKRLVFLHETPPDQMGKLLTSVKGLITEKITNVNRKGIERYKAENFANLMAVANDMPEGIEQTNRRWGVIGAADDAVGADVRGQGGPEHARYYKRLWGIIPPDGSVTDELRRVLHYLRNLSLAKFDPLVAPLTETKEEAAETDKIFAKVAPAYRDHKGPFRFNLLTAEDAARHLATACDRELTDAMQEAGCRRIRRANGRAAQVTMPDGTRPRMWAINPAVAKQYADTSTAELVRLYEEERAAKPKAKPEPQPEPEPEPWQMDPMPPGDWEGDTVH